MFPVLFEAGPLKVQSYGFFVALGYLGAVLMVRKAASREGFAPGGFMDLCFALLLSGVIGGRALFVLTNLDHFSKHPEEIPTFWSGGLVFYGGFLTASAVCLLWLRWKKIPAARGLDVLAPGLALGHGIGRIGCFAAGCCHGSVCSLPWAVRMDSGLVSEELRGLLLHPVQLYEAFGLFAISAAIFWYGKRRPPAGNVAALYLVSYAGLRAVVEIFRGDEVRGFLPGTALSTSQAIAGILFFFGAGFLAWRGFRRHH